MKKEYLQPSIEVAILSQSDVLTKSTGNELQEKDVTEIGINYNWGDIK